MNKTKKKVVIKDVAALAGVSVGSVSKYLNDIGNLKPLTKSRIKSAIDKLEYEPDYLARSMRTGKTNSIAVVVPDITNPFFAEIYNSIKQCAVKKGLFPILYTTDYDLHILKKYLSTQSIKNSDGIILCFVDDEQAIAEIIKKTQHVPIVLVNWDIDKPIYSTVGVNIFEGAIKATEHLINLGHKFIGYIGGQDMTSKEKRRGYEKAILSAKLDLNKNFEYHNNFDLQTGYEAAQKFMNLKEKPTAIFAENDILAIGFIKYCLQNKIKVPDDISVIGFDNIMLSEMYEPSLSTVSLPIEKIGKEAINLIIESQSDGEQKIIMLDNELIERNSTRKINT